MKITPLLFALAIAPIGAPAYSAPAAKSKPAPKVVPPTWKPATVSQRTAAAASIRAQLDAFKRNDWAKAATYQSAGLRQQFGTVAQVCASSSGRSRSFAPSSNAAIHSSPNTKASLSRRRGR